MSPPHTIYCSGPLFCPEEIAGMTRIAQVLEDAGFATFLPHRDGLEAYVLPLANEPVAQLPGGRTVTRMVNRAIFALDIFQIVERCDGLVFNMNGRVPDEGGVVETAVAFAAGKPLVIYKEDARSKVAGSDNAMLLGLAPAFRTIDRVDAIPAALSELIERCPPSSYEGDAIPENMRRTLRLGRRVWSVVSRLDTHERAVPSALIDALEQCDEA